MRKNYDSVEIVLLGLELSDVVRTSGEGIVMSDDSDMETVYGMPEWF